METAAKTWREGWDSEGQWRRNWQRSPRAKMSLGTKAEMAHTLALPGPTPGHGRWTATADRKRLIPLEDGVAGELCGPPGRWTSGSWSKLSQECRWRPNTCGCPPPGVSWEDSNAGEKGRPQKEHPQIRAGWPQRTPQACGSSSCAGLLRTGRGWRTPLTHGVTCEKSEPIRQLVAHMTVTVMKQKTDVSSLSILENNVLSLNSMLI